MSSEALGETRREQILDAATKVFVRRGFHKARIDDIVEEAGLSKGAVYWYFDSKDAIITAILDRFLQREFEALQEIISSDQDVESHLYRMIDQLSGEVERSADLMPLAYEFYAVATRQKEVRRSLKSFFDQHLGLFESLIMEGVRQGEFREVDPRDTAISLISLIEGLTLLWTIGILDQRANPLPDLVRAGVELSLQGLKARA